MCSAEYWASKITLVNQTKNLPRNSPTSIDDINRSSISSFEDELPITTGESQEDKGKYSDDTDSTFTKAEYDSEQEVHSRESEDIGNLMEEKQDDTPPDDTLSLLYDED